MEKERTVTMAIREIKRLRVIEEVIEGKLRQSKAAKLLKISTRQMRRIVNRVKTEGAEGIIHRLRGRASNRKHSEGFKAKILNLCRHTYEGFGPTLAQEKLEERNKLSVSRETLRQWMLEEGLWEISKKGREHREWRERKPCLGEMVQADGSHHDWLESRGPELVLMGYIDDATSRVFALFYDYEGTIPAMDSFYRYSKKHGLPHSIYIDRLKAYCGDGKPSLEEELEGRDKAPSQFERALDELGVEIIHAQSPQAKGRIERLFKTFQDRLIKEMRLEAVKTKEEANRFLETYLPKYNRRFSVKAREEADLHRPALRDRELLTILSIHHKRVVRNDYTVRYGTKLYQILESDSKLKEVVTQERIDGKFYLVHGGRELKYRELREPPRQAQPSPKKRSYAKPSIPALNHPWRRWSPSEAQKALAAA